MDFCVPSECARRLESGGADLGIVPDRRDATRAALREAARAHDLILTSGGVSVGEEDHLKPAVEAEGRLARIDRWPNLAVALMARSPETHTLRPLWLQQRMNEIVDEEIERVLVGAAGSAAA